MLSGIAQALNRAWRIVATGLSFAVFGLGGFLLGTVVCLPMRLMIPDREAYSQAVRGLVSRSFRCFAGFMSLVGVLRWRVAGRENWDPGRPYLVVANHPSLIDIIFLVGLFHGADCVVKRGVTRNPAFALLVRAADFVSNEDAGQLVADCVSRLRAGRTVVLFPEGTRTTPGRAPEFGSAAATIAVRAGCDLLPVEIRSDPPTLYKGLPWYRVPPSRAGFELTIHSAWPVPAFEGSVPARRQAAHYLTRQLRVFFSDRLESRTDTGLFYNDQAVSGTPPDQVPSDCQ